jgi:hypothetical protein
VSAYCTHRLQATLGGSGMFRAERLGCGARMRIDEDGMLKKLPSKGAEGGVVHCFRLLAGCFRPEARHN